ncbi:GDSL esterase/lipase At5g03610-like [Lolium rigidum]|uniref:GDSL esterase/lipase At5g03610-like n=1 Tax=Lolium rigidum TaxID=89674 RepID=UPI001F5C6974|nr:GDSL esterase/lipase At5g03610-like [Lolium rigidum]
MKPSAIISLACVLLFLLNVPRVESSRPQGLGAGHHAPGQGHHPGHDGGHQNDQPDPDYNGYSFYVFGDSFADNGNLLKKYPNSELTRQWYPPYQASGRFSNLLVQSDFIAMLLGQPASPPAHRQTRGVGPVGMNFAAGGSGVYDVPGTPTLARQVHTFNKLVKDGDIKQEHLDGQSLALIAVDGNDYARVRANASSLADIESFVETVVEEIEANVVRLQNIGVKKVLVNNLFPLGCAPSLTRRTGYSGCDEEANQDAALHNHLLFNQLTFSRINGMDGVLLLDLDAAFSRIVGPSPDADMVNLFPNRLVPCCDSWLYTAYCGQVDPDTDGPLYRVCDNPDSHFFWDEMNPTQVGWEAVMGQLEGPIREFLGLIT